MKPTLAVNIKKTSEERRVVYGEVYAPDRLDTDGEFMTADEIIKMAYNFMYKGHTGNIDQQHDFDSNNPAYVAESFIAEGMPPYIDGSWVVGVHIPDDDLWNAVKSGEFNGFSMAGLANQAEAVIEIDVPSVIKGSTVEEGSHTHTFTIRFSDEGEFLGGETDIVDGHYHTISKATITDSVNDHHHKFSFLEFINAQN